jgi:hypothetical protein
MAETTRRGFLQALAATVAAWFRPRPWKCEDPACACRLPPKYVIEDAMRHDVIVHGDYMAGTFTVPQNPVATYPPGYFLHPHVELDGIGPYPGKDGTFTIKLGGIYSAPEIQ